MTSPVPTQTTIQEEILGWVLCLAFVAVGIVINYPGIASLMALVLFLAWRG